MGAALARLCQTDIQQRHPILKRLQCETAEYQSYAKGAESSLRQVVSVVLDKRIDQDAEPRDQARHQSYPNGK